MTLQQRALLNSLFVAVEFNPRFLLGRLNTSNKNKLKEFQRLFKSHGADLDVTQIDLREIDASPEEVVAHKVSAGE
jgi:hypothetical protein